jgi:hypothetical protein
MTLGPMIVLIPLLENARGRVARWLAVFGRVPFFYYVLHIPLIHVVAVLISLMRTPSQTSWLVANHPMMPPPVPAGYTWSLTLLYVVTALVVVALYFPCRWFAGLKARRRGVDDVRVNGSRLHASARHAPDGIISAPPNPPRATCIPPPAASPISRL